MGIDDNGVVKLSSIAFSSSTTGIVITKDAYLHTLRTLHPFVQSEDSLDFDQILGFQTINQNNWVYTITNGTLYI